MSLPQDPFSLSIAGVADLVGNKTNKQHSTSGFSPEGVESEKYGALTLNMSDEELLKLRNEWEKRYAPYESKIKPKFERNLESYLGKKKDGQWLYNNDLPTAANLQFEAEETFLAAALAKNPEPVVWADNTPEGNKISNAVKTMLQFHFDQLVLRRKLAMMVRQWSIYHLGVLKYGWNNVINDVSIENRKIQDFIFDPTGFVDSYGDFSSYLGERITVTAEKLVELFPEHRDYISGIVEGKMGTDVVYTEWWTDEYCFTTFKEKVLDKHKNPYFKYPEVIQDKVTDTDPETGEEVVLSDEVLSEPHNHFAVPKKPYTFLSVFSLQEQPHDITGLIEQNIPNQNRIAKQTDQIDYNIDASNNGYAFSEDNFNQETGKQAATARKKGHPILIPSGGPIDKAIMPLPAQSLPNEFFANLESHKDDLRSSWGIQGIAPQPADEDQTARGMILSQSQDTSRIGGGIGDAIEQVAKSAANWLTQLYYVFYDEKHFGVAMGGAKALEFIVLWNQDLNRQLIVTVAPDSMKPQDEITEINLAQNLFDKGAIGPLTLLKRLDFADPEEAAADGVLYRADPMAYMQINFPEYAAQVQALAQQKAQQDMMNQAQQTGMDTAAEAANTPPEASTEPKGDLSQDPASAALSQVPLPPLPAA